ncbi:MAG: hypothetical protein L6R42_009339 [Xanthoria sp. 1 TBL-2021]|nr:MAG: hypothetical protein L6R42_009339 [Xanthoria sp. 1 TBL-2021]
MLPGDHLPLATVGETTPLACYVNSDIAAHDYPGPSHDELDVPYSGPDDAKIDVNSGAPAVPRDHLQRTTVGGKTSLACHANSDTSPLDYPTPDDTELDMNGARSHETLGPLSYPSSNAASSFSSQSEGPPHDEWEKQIQAWIREADDSHDPTGILEEATKHLANAPLRIQNRWRIFKILLLV